MSRLLALVFASVLLTACNLDSGPPRLIRLEGAGAASRSDAQTIAARLDAYTLRGIASAKPKYTWAVDGADAIIAATAAPADEHTQYLLGRRGLLDVRSENGNLWFDDSAVADVEAAVDDRGRPSLRVRLNDMGTARVAKLSATPSPATVNVRLDDELLSVARVTGPITQGRLEISLEGKTLDEVHLIATLMRFGRLSYAPGKVRIAVPNGQV